MKLQTKARFCALLIPFLTILSACGGQNSSPANPIPPFIDDSTVEIPMEDSVENGAENSGKPVPAPPQSSVEPAPAPPMIDGVWNLSDVDISGVCKDRKLISFTFDDAPSRTLENIFAVYADYNETHPDAPAFATVFFNGGLFDAQTPHLLATARALGFELGNHTQSHYDLTTLNETQLKEEIDKTDELLGFADGKARHLLRAPFGKTNELVQSVAPTPMIDWTIDTLDWTGVSEDAIYHAVFDNRFSGAIVLMHDGYAHTVDALKRLLPDLYDEGYQVVSVSQMAKMHGCTLRQGKTYIRARKQASALENP